MTINSNCTMGLFEMNHTDACSICLDPMDDHLTACIGHIVFDEQIEIKDGRSEIKQRVAHLYHQKCMFEWLSNNDTCPECRATFINKDYIVLNIKEPAMMYLKNLHDAICVGNLNEVQSLFKIQGAPISKEDRDDFVRLACVKGRVTVLKELLVNSRFNGLTISEKHRGKAVIWAIKYGHLDMVKLLLANEASITEEHRGKAVVEASKNGHLDVVRKLVISEEHRGLAVVEASKNGRLDVVRELLANEASITRESRGRAVVEASKNGHLDVAIELLADWNPISEEDRGLAVVEASKNGRLTVVIELLTNEASITRESRGRAVVCASTHGHLDVAIELLADWNPISEEDRGLAVVEASQNGHLDVVRELLANEAPIPEEHRGLAVENASKNGRLDVVRELLAHKAPISDRQRGRAVVGASRNGHLDVVKKLLAKRRIERTVLDQALQLATTRNFATVASRIQWQIRKQQITNGPLFATVGAVESLWGRMRGKMSSR